MTKMTKTKRFVYYSILLFVLSMPVFAGVMLWLNR